MSAIVIDTSGSGLCLAFWMRDPRDPRRWLVDFGINFLSNVAAVVDDFGTLVLVP